MLLPNLMNYFNLDLLTMPILLFRVFGLIMIVTLLYISLGYAKRLEASTKTYNQIIEKLPLDFQRVKVSTLSLGKLFELRTSYLLIYIMFLALTAIDILLIIYAT